MDSSENLPHGRSGGGLAEADRRRRTASAKRVKRNRLALLVVAWVVGVPASILLWLYLRWIGALIVAAMIWMTWDYYRKGDMLSVIEASQREGRYLPPFFRKDGLR